MSLTRHWCSSLSPSAIVVVVQLLSSVHQSSGYSGASCRSRSATTVVRGRLLATHAVHCVNIDRGRPPSTYHRRASESGFRYNARADYRRRFIPPPIRLGRRSRVWASARDVQQKPPRICVIEMEKRLRVYETRKA